MTPSRRAGVPPWPVLTDAVVALAPRLWAPVDYYVAMARHGRAVVDTTMPYDKHAKDVHRYDIAGSRGRRTLTVPVARPETSRCRWDQVEISSHGRWWETQVTALESAYGRTPYFQFYIDRLSPMFRQPGPADTMMGLVEAADRAVRAILGLDAPVTYGPVEGAEAAVVVDLRGGVPQSPQAPYYQVRAGELGFIPGLSVLDLIFNLGPEAALYIGHRL